MRSVLPFPPLSFYNKGKPFKSWWGLQHLVLSSRPINVPYECFENQHYLQLSTWELS